MKQRKMLSTKISFDENTEIPIYKNQDLVPKIQNIILKNGILILTYSNIAFEEGYQLNFWAWAYRAFFKFWLNIISF